MLNWSIILLMLTIVTTVSASESGNDKLASRVWASLNAADLDAAATGLAPTQAEVVRLAVQERRSGETSPAWRLDSIVAPDLAILCKEIHKGLVHELSECWRLLTSLGVDIMIAPSKVSFTKLNEGEYLVADIGLWHAIAVCGTVVAEDGRRSVTSMYLRGVVVSSEQGGPTTVTVLYYPSDLNTERASLFGGDMIVAMRVTLRSGEASPSALFDAMDGAVRSSSAAVLNNLRKDQVTEDFAPFTDATLSSALTVAFQQLDLGFDVAKVEAQRFDQAFLYTTAQAREETLKWAKAPPLEAKEFTAISEVLTKARATLNDGGKFGDVVSRFFAEPMRSGWATIGASLQSDTEKAFAIDRASALTGLNSATSDMTLWRMSAGHARARVALTDDEWLSIECIKEQADWRISDLSVHRPGK